MSRGVGGAKALGSAPPPPPAGAAEGPPGPSELSAAGGMGFGGNSRCRGENRPESEALTYWLLKNTQHKEGLKNGHSQEPKEA